MRRIVPLLFLSVTLLWLGCDARTEQTDSGGILLEVEFAADNIPIRASVNNLDLIRFLQVPTVTVTSIIADPDSAVTSDLQNIELEGFEVVYTREDSGTRVPPPYIINLLGTIPVGGQLTYNNLPVMSFEQIRNPPLSDLLFENGGFDKETGDTVIVLNLWIRAFGRTLGNRPVESVPRPHTIEFVQ